MGLKLSRISELPEGTGRRVFIYFLDYGWDEPLSRAMYENFDRLARVAADHGAVVMAGLDRIEFADEVLSWHSANGRHADDLLPAIMITDWEPRSLSDARELGPMRRHRRTDTSYPERFLILPLREICKSPSEVAQLMERISNDLQSGLELKDFAVAGLIGEHEGGLADMLILRPTVAGLGVDLKKAFEFGRAEIRKRFGREPRK